MNTELLEKIAAHIEAEPKTFRMDGYECDTWKCIAGHATRMSGFKGRLTFGTEPGSFFHTAMTKLNINDEQAIRLFYSSNWPSEFLPTGREWNNPTGAQGAARIRHFISTKGAE